MIACGRRCCLCHRFCGVGMECHHIEPPTEGGENTFANCIPLCFDCHAEVGHYSPNHPKGTKFSTAELRSHRDRWYTQFSTGLPGDAPREHLELDRTLAKTVVRTLGGQTAMMHFRDHDYHGRFSANVHDRLFDFQRMVDLPASFFFDAQMEGGFADLKTAIAHYLSCSTNTIFPDLDTSTKIGIPPEWELGENPNQQKRHLEAVDVMNAAASVVWTRFSDFARKIRGRLLIDPE